METMSRVGVGIVTYNREEYLGTLLNSLPKVDHLVLVNDGEALQLELPDLTYIKNEKNLGVGVSKNKALQHLMENTDSEYLFLFEDDIFVKDPAVFERYIEVIEKTGLQHLNFSQHGVCNKTAAGAPRPVAVIEYKKIQVPFYIACVGAMSVYTRKCIETVGYMDERYFNACEHVEHSHRIHLAGMSPGFWWYADAPDSHKLLGDHGWSLETSTIHQRPDARENIARSDAIFKETYGAVPREMPRQELEEFLRHLKQIKKQYAV
jgi:GT2 family glycosyltransferase